MRIFTWNQYKAFTFMFYRPEKNQSVENVNYCTTVFIVGWTINRKLQFNTKLSFFWRKYFSSSQRISKPALNVVSKVKNHDR